MNIKEHTYFYSESNKKNDDKMHIDEIRRTLIRDWQDLKEHFLDEERQKRLPHMTPFQRCIRIPIWLIKALMQKLNWFRRLLLILSFVMIYQGLVTVSGAGNSHSEVGPGFVIGFLLLLFVLMLELKDKVLARNELEAGRGVQNALRPDQCPTVPGWGIWLYTRSANDVGGDLLDFIAIPPQRYGVALGDVSDKGLAAALLMAKLQATLRALAPDSPGLADLGQKLNRIFYQDGLSKNFASLIYLELSPASGQINWINAGHLPPVLLRQRQLTELPKGDAALGLAAHTLYSKHEWQMEAGDVLLIYSDGLSEARNEFGKFFGEERIEKVLANSASLNPKDIGASLLHHVDRFIGDARLHDDLTIALIQKLAD
jgi:phosphoserine phosphatase RsbU/P